MRIGGPLTSGSTHFIFWLFALLMSHVVEQVYRTFDRSREMRPRGLKPSLLLGALRGAEAPRFHGTAYVFDCRPDS